MAAKIKKDVRPACEVVEQLLEEHNLTLEGLSSKIGLSTFTLSKFTRGSMYAESTSYGTLQDMIKRAFSVPQDFFDKKPGGQEPKAAPAPKPEPPLPKAVSPAKDKEGPRIAPPPPAAKPVEKPIEKKIERTEERPPVIQEAKTLNKNNTPEGDTDMSVNPKIKYRPAKVVLADIMEVYNIPLEGLATALGMEAGKLELYVNGPHQDEDRYHALKDRLQKKFGLPNDAFFAEKDGRSVMEMLAKASAVQPEANKPAAEPQKFDGMPEPQPAPKSEPKSEPKSAEVPQAAADAKPATYDQLSSKLSTEICNLVKSAFTELKDKHKDAIPKKPVFQGKDAAELVDIIPKLSPNDLKFILEMARRLVPAE